MFRAQRHIELGASNPSGAGAIDHDNHIADLLFHNLQGIEQARAGDNGSAMLVIMKDRNIAGALQFALDKETFGRLDVFQVDTAKGGRNHLDKAHDLVGVFAIDLNVKDINIGKALKEYRLALHYRLGSQWAPVAQPQNGRAIADHRHEIALGCVLIGQRRVIGNLQHRPRHSRRIGQRQILLRIHRLGCHNL